MRLRARAAFLLATALAVAGCRRRSADVGAVGGAASASTPSKSASSAPAPPDGVVYVAVNGRGVVRVASGRVETAYATTGDVGPLRVGADGAAYAVADRHLVRVDATGEAKVLAALDERAVSLAVASDGTAWIGDDHAVRRFAGGVKTDLPLPTGDRECRYLAVDAHDVLYCSAATTLAPPAPRSTLHRWKGAAWEPVPFAEANVGSLELGPDDRIVIGVAGGFFVVGADGATQPLGDHAGATLFSLRATPRGDALVWAQPKSFVWRRDGRWLERDLSGRASSDPDPVVDARGRVWFTSKRGAFTVDDGGKAIDVWPRCSLFGDVVDFAVTAGGPTLPTSPPPPVRGPVRGRLVRAKTPLAEVAVVAASPLALLGEGEDDACTIHGGAPALAAIGMFGDATQTKTDADGRFVLLDVPRGAQSLMVISPDLPAITALNAPALTCCAQMKDEAGVDLGDVVVP